MQMHLSTKKQTHKQKTTYGCWGEELGEGWSGRLELADADH